jgi:hypothetical protein
LGNDTYDYTQSEDVYGEDLDNNAEKKKAKLEKKKKEAAERVIDQ